jgi:hypothetical protein
MICKSKPCPVLFPWIPAHPIFGYNVVRSRCSKEVAEHLLYIVKSRKAGSFPIQSLRAWLFRSDQDARLLVSIVAKLIPRYSFDCQDKRVMKGMRADYLVVA